MVAIRVAIVSVIVGAGWVVYLTWFADPFPADILRYVPVIWLVSAFAGLILGPQATLANVHRTLRYHQRASVSR